ncbi:MAG: motility associated factor glycosyltransferase family protein [Treponema sp.]|nr:motility associated factor glycosyltransferase family protein [Treponema sp.]
MTEVKNQKPCLVETGQGFSVIHEGKLLYSKYNPSKGILGKIQSMDILPGSVLLCFSAVLDYGIKELLNKIPKDTVLFFCEYDTELSAFIMQNRTLDNYLDDVRCIFLSKYEMLNLPVILQKNDYCFECGKKISLAGRFRRVIRLDFSSGFQFHPEFYNKLESACVSSIKQFWTNRFTLAKFGRKYSRNMFLNLRDIDNTKQLNYFIGSVERDIFVFGSGESAEKGIEICKEAKNPFILCADTAFQMLNANNIIPNGIVVDEAQSVICQSFIGVRKAAFEGVQIFQSLCSLPHVAGKNFPKNQISFYATEYASNSFFENLKAENFFPPVVPAMGSVGITAYILAHLFRKNNTVPVYVYGLDFAYSKGKTHARGTPAHNRQIKKSNRLIGIENFYSCYSQNVLISKQNKDLPFSTPILKSYAETFRQVQEQINEISESIINNWKLKKITCSKENKCTVNDFLDKEKIALNRIKSILSGEIKMEEENRYKILKELLLNREYLYLHFPDGYALSMELNFLKRVRSEIDGFLKHM